MALNFCIFVITVMSTTVLVGHITPAHNKEKYTRGLCLNYPVLSLILYD